MCMLSLCILDNGGPKGWARLNKTLTRHKSVLVAFKQKTSTQRNAQQISSVSRIISCFNFTHFLSSENSREFEINKSEGVVA